MAISMIELSIAASITPTVVLASVNHLYRGETTGARMPSSAAIATRIELVFLKDRPKTTKANFINQASIPGTGPQGRTAKEPRFTKPGFLRQ
jgi:hypothetical protein